MKKTKVDEKMKHEKLAILAFVLTLIIALGAFYYIWTSQASFGLDIAGTQKYFCAEWSRAHGSDSPCPQITVQTPTKSSCCCKLVAGTSKFNKYTAWVDTPTDEATYTDRCTTACSTTSPSTGQQVSVLNNIGKCNFITG